MLESKNSPIEDPVISEDPIITEEGIISEDPPADAAEVEPQYFDSSKLDSEDSKNMARDVIICKTIEQV